MKHVIYRENSNTHMEVFLAGMDPQTEQPVIVNDARRALHFEDAATAYRFAHEWHPKLQWWRIGLR